jgi:hypothetical protein
LESLITDVDGPPYQGTAILPIRVVHDEYLWKVDIPLKWTGSLVCDSGRFAGEREPYITFGEIFMDSNFCEIYIAIQYGNPLLPPAEDTLVYLYFTVQDTGFASFDTVCGGGPERYLYFIDSTLTTIQPYIERPWLYHITPYPPGDVNLDGSVDPGDVVFLINYLFREGSPPDFPELGDVNGDCVVNGSDVVYLISYLFKNGPAPQNGCAF